MEIFLGARDPSPLPSSQPISLALVALVSRGSVRNGHNSRWRLALDYKENLPLLEFVTCIRPKRTENFDGNASKKQMSHLSLRAESYSTFGDGADC